MDWQAVLLCGGKGTRLGEVTGRKLPKPMVEIGGYPILLHIMKQYSAAGIKRFVICAGHQSWEIKSYFLNYRHRLADITIRPGSDEVICHPTGEIDPDWEIIIVETGEETQTAGRLQKVQNYIDADRFMLTYGDGLSDVALNKLAGFHQDHGKAITITGVIPPGRFGELVVEGDCVVEMQEKPTVSDRFINGGFMVVNKEFVQRFIGADADDMMLERAPFAHAARAGEMMMYKHHGFWQCMDTLRDWELLNELWRKGSAPWTR
jgi:glucose-1-phosphate cytidylyltransferase